MIKRGKSQRKLACRKFLEEKFSKEEIKNAVWDCGLEKSPG